MTCITVGSTIYHSNTLFLWPWVLCQLWPSFHFNYRLPLLFPIHGLQAVFSPHTQQGEKAEAVKWFIWGLLEQLKTQNGLWYFCRNNQQYLWLTNNPVEYSNLFLDLFPKHPLTCYYSLLPVTPGLFRLSVPETKRYRQTNIYSLLFWVMKLQDD